MSGTLLASEVNLPLTSLDRNDSWHNGVRNVLKFHCSFSEFQTKHFCLEKYQVHIEMGNVILSHLGCNWAGCYVSSGQNGLILMQQKCSCFFKVIEMSCIIITHERLLQVEGKLSAINPVSISYICRVLGYLS